MNQDVIQLGYKLRGAQRPGHIDPRSAISTTAQALEKNLKKVFKGG